MNSVNDLVAAIQHGREDLIPELWDSIRGLVAFFARRFYFLYGCGRFGVEVEDLVQCGYFALLEALRLHDPEKGAFSTYFYYQLRRCFQNAVGRTRRKISDPINHCKSFDAPVDDEEETKLYDLVPDDRDYIGETEQKIYLEQLRAELEKALGQINEQYADVLRGLFYDSQTLRSLAMSKDVTFGEISRRKIKGLRALRHCKETEALRQFLDDAMPSRIAGMRPTETAVIMREDLSRMNIRENWLV